MLLSPNSSLRSSSCSDNRMNIGEKAPTSIESIDGKLTPRSNHDSTNDRQTMKMSLQSQSQSHNLHTIPNGCTEPQDQLIIADQKQQQQLQLPIVSPSESILHGDNDGDSDGTSNNSNNSVVVSSVVAPKINSKDDKTNKTSPPILPELLNDDLIPKQHSCWKKKFLHLKQQQPQPTSSTTSAHTAAARTTQSNGGSAVDYLSLRRRESSISRNNEQGTDDDDIVVIGGSDGGTRLPQNAEHHKYYQGLYHDPYAQAQAQAQAQRPPLPLTFSPSSAFSKYYPKEGGDSYHRHRHRHQHLDHCTSTHPQLGLPQQEEHAKLQLQLQQQKQKHYGTFDQQPSQRPHHRTQVDISEAAAILCKIKSADPPTSPIVLESYKKLQMQKRGLDADTRVEERGLSLRLGMSMGTGTGTGITGQKGLVSGEQGQGQHKRQRRETEQQQEQEPMIIQDLTKPPAHAPKVSNFFGLSSSFFSSWNTKHDNKKSHRRISKEEIYDIATAQLGRTMNRKNSRTSNVGSVSSVGNGVKSAKRAKVAVPKTGKRTVSDAASKPLATAKGKKRSGTGSSPRRELPNRLALPTDPMEVNSLHCYVRSDLLELFVVPPRDCTAYSSPKTATKSRRYADYQNDDDCAYSSGSEKEDDREGEESENGCEGEGLSSSCRTRRSRCHINVKDVPPKKTTVSYSTSRRHIPGRVGLRCVHCAHLDSHRDASPTAATIATKADFFPRSIHQLYREVCTWQRVHFQHCTHVPAECRKKYKYLKESDKSRGKTKYWEMSARELGLVDAFNANGDHDGIQFKNF